MAAAGQFHTVVLTSEGRAVAFGSSQFGQCSVPELPAGVRYVGCGAGCEHTVLLTSDGRAVVFGRLSTTSLAWEGTRPAVPELPEGVRYVACAAGSFHTVLLRSDGRAVAFGGHRYGQCSVPELPEGLRYVRCAGGGGHTVLLTSEGRVVAFGGDAAGGGLHGTDVGGVGMVPELPESVRYVGCAAGREHTVLLTSEGHAVAFCYPSALRPEPHYYAVSPVLLRRCTVPELPEGVRYVGCAAGAFHTVLLRSDGLAVAFGDTSDGKCVVPDLVEGARYVGCAAGFENTILLTSEGRAVAFGADRTLSWTPWRAVPELSEGVRYVDPAVERARARLSLALVSRRSEDRLVRAAVEVMTMQGFEQAIGCFL